MKIYLIFDGARFVKAANTLECAKDSAETMFSFGSIAQWEKADTFIEKAWEYKNCKIAEHWLEIDVTPGALWAHSGFMFTELDTGNVIICQDNTYRLLSPAEFKQLLNPTDGCMQTHVLKLAKLLEPKPRKEVLL